MYGWLGYVIAVFWLGVALLPAIAIWHVWGPGKRH